MRSGQSNVQGPKSNVLRAWTLALFLLSAFCILPSALAQGIVTPTWTFQDAFTNTLTSKLVTIERLSAIGNNGNLISLGDTGYGRTTNSSFTTNLLNGFYYRITIATSRANYSFTNFFDANTTGAVDGGNPLYRAFGQPQDRTVFAPSLPYALAIFALKTSGVLTNPAFYGLVKFPDGGGFVGDVWTKTNADGSGAWVTPTGGGGGGGTGNVTGPGSSSIGNVAVFSSTDGKHIGDGGLLGTAAFLPSSTWDPAGSSAAVQSFATAYSNSVNLASGNSAAVSTNRFITPAQLAILSNNINGANIFGQVPASSLGSGSSISTKFLRGDLTWQSIVGGGDMLAANNLSDVANPTTALANLNGVRNSRTLTINGTANQITSSAGAQDLTADRTWTLSFPNLVLFPLSMAADTAVFTNGVTNLSLTASTMLKADSNKKIVSATAGSDFVAPSTTLTINGTANQITSSAGAQDLSANRTVTLSLPSAVTLPGTLNVTGDQTNQGNFSVKLNQTNFGNLRVLGTITGNGSGITSLNGANVTAGTLSSNALDSGSLAQLFAFHAGNGVGVFTNDNSGNQGYAPLLDASALKASQYVATDANTNLVSTQNGNQWTNMMATNIMVSTNNWNWGGPTNSLDFVKGVLQRYHPTDTTAINITNVANFPPQSPQSVVLWIENTNTSAINVKLPATCEATNSLGGLTVSVNASNRLQILVTIVPSMSGAPGSTNASFADQQLIK